jgi:hypothetical protein
MASKKVNPNLRLYDEFLPAGDYFSNKTKRIALYHMRKKEEELIAEEKYNKENFCPKCFLIKPRSGICDNCE